MFGPSGLTVAVEKKEHDDLKVPRTRKGLKDTTGGRCLSHDCSFMWALRLWPILSSFTGYIFFRKAWESLPFDYIKRKLSFIPWFTALRKGLRHLGEGILNSYCTPDLFCKFGRLPYFNGFTILTICSQSIDDEKNCKSWGGKHIYGTVLLSHPNVR